MEGGRRQNVQQYENWCNREHSANEVIILCIAFKNFLKNFFIVVKYTS